MTSFISKKFIQTILAEVGLLGYMFVARPEGQMFYVAVAALVTLALGYNLANAWLGRAVAKNGVDKEA